MSMTYIKIENPGVLSTVQDAGRYGYQGLGFPVSGCMDMRAYHDANALLNNDPDDAVIEMQLMGVRVRFLGNAFFAVTGAKMSMQLNGHEISGYRAYEAHDGDVLSIGAARSGRFAYLAVSGGITVDAVMGSRSTNLKCHLGGFEGRALQAGDVLPVGQGSEWLDNLYLKEMIQLLYEKKLVVRVIAGPQEDHFTDKGLSDFEEKEYVVSEKSDRMGYRLEGPPIEMKKGADILSDGIVFGSIQVAADGKPMILMADRQTTGGYAKIATVIRADLPRLSQSVPGTEIRFRFVSLEEAQKINKKYSSEMKKFDRKSGYVRRKRGKQNG